MPIKKDTIVRLHSEFEAMIFTWPETEAEFWFARDLMHALGYSRWENFTKVTEKAKSACSNSGYTIADHFRDVTKKVSLGSGATRNVDDIALTRYACYLIAQNGDPSKPEIAFAQTYFALQTRKQEVIEKRLAEVERLSARKKLTTSEKVLSGVIFEKLDDDRSFAKIRSKGDQALFGGRKTADMKKKLGVSEKRPLADFLPTITIKAKDFANEVTITNIRRDDIRDEQRISDEHVKSNEDVRNVLVKRGIYPEELPADEDLKKVERRLKSEEKRLPKCVDPLEVPKQEE